MEPSNHDRNTWKDISNTLDIDFIYSNIQDWSCKKIDALLIVLVLPAYGIN